MSWHILNVKTREYKIRINHADEQNAMKTNCEKCQWSTVQCWLIDWVVVLRPAPHKIGHFRASLFSLFLISFQISNKAPDGHWHAAKNTYEIGLHIKDNAISKKKINTKIWLGVGVQCRYHRETSHVHLWGHGWDVLNCLSCSLIGPSSKIFAATSTSEWRCSRHETSPNSARKCSTLR